MGYILEEAKSAKLKDGDYAEIRHFWDYVLEKRLCNGSNPIITIKGKRKRIQTNKFRVLRELTLTQVDELYKVLKKDVDGMSVAISLLISGFTRDDIVRLKIKDFSLINESFVVVTFFRNFEACAVHNYSRVLLPQTARIVYMYIKKLKSKYAGRNISGYPVAGQRNDPRKGLTEIHINNTSKIYLNAIGITEEELKAVKGIDPMLSPASILFKNTYEYLIDRVCNLIEDVGLSTYLKGKSLSGNVSAEHYIDFSNKAALRKQRAIFAILDSETEMPMETEEFSENGIKVNKFSPHSTREIATTKIEGILAPGQELEVSAMYGVGMQIRCKRYDTEEI